MTAISPYAPIRRQSSLLSNASNGGGGGGRMLRRSSSTGLVANATLFYTFVQYWRRIMSRSSDSKDDGNDGGRIRDFLNTLCELVSCHLTVHDDHLNCSQNDNGATVKRRGISAVVRWLVTIVGGDRSRMGKIITIAIGFAREVLIRSITAANVVLTGISPKLIGTDTASDRNERIENESMSDDFKPVLGEGSFDRNINNTLNGGSRDQLSLDEIRTDRKEIDKVLSYWFGKASPDGAQKSLWMIASSSVELLHQVDSDISEKFRLLVLDLSNSSSDRVQRWTEDVNIFGWQGKMAAIIALDQISRHIHRYDKNNKRNLGGIKCIPEQKKLDSIAYEIATKLQSQHQQELSTGIIPIPMRIFGIMPLRHASTVQDLGIVQQDVEASSTLHEEMDRMIRRFRKATNRRMAALQDEARREGKLGLIENNAESTNDLRQQHFDDEQILECFPFKADMSKANEHAVVKTMSAFLTKMNILQLSDTRFKSSRKTANSLDSKKNKNNKSPTMSTPPTSNPDVVPTAIVSLSGGVDSMVIASALAYLRDTEAERRNTTPDKVLHIVGIHIDYGNRPESGAEAAYVGRYCKDLGAKFICRKIDEVKRGVTARDDYERIAREIRFSLYRQCSAEARDGTKEGGVGIMLGHHRGDLRENVISNAHKGCGPLDLSGMTAVSKNDGVTLFRPLLSLEKSFIYDYSHTYGVPYFKDTTPHWSTRGKLRNRLIPLLEEIYGEGSMDNLSSLAEESDDARALIQQTVMGPFMEQVKRYPMGITFETSAWKDCGLFFWKFILRQVLHSAGLGMFSDKSVESFLERVQATNLKQGWLQCRKDYAVFLQKDGRVFVLFPSSFPFGNGRKKAQYDQSSKFLGYGSDKRIEVGPWSITCEVGTVNSEEEATSHLQTKAIQNMEHLMAGDIQYCMKVPIVGKGLPCPLARITGFTKPTRPAAWKAVDLKVESTLPLLGVDESSSDEITSGPQQLFGKTWTIVHVRLLLNSTQTRGSSDKSSGVGMPQDLNS